MNKIDKRILREILSYRRVFKKLAESFGYVKDCQKFKNLGLLPYTFALMPEIEMVTWGKSGEASPIAFPNKVLLEINIKQICIRYGY